MSEVEQSSIPLTPFTVALMEQSARDTEWSVNATIEAEKQRADRAEAKLRLILRKMYGLLDQPWTPSSDAVRRALWPTEEEIEEEIEEEKERGK